MRHRPRCPYCNRRRCPNSRSRDPQPQDCPEYDYAAWLAALAPGDDEAAD